MSDTVLGQTDVRRILGNVSEGRRGVKSSHIPSSMKNMTCIEDLRLAARRRVPRAFFGYAEAGSYSEETLRANRADMERVRLRQRVLVDVSGRDTSATILGETVSLPLALAPIGLGGLQHGNGEILACRAAQAAGIPYTLTTMSICSIEDVAGAVEKPFWFQLYVMKDRGFARSLVERAAAAGCSALSSLSICRCSGSAMPTSGTGFRFRPRSSSQTSSTWRQSLAGPTACSPEGAGRSAISPAISRARRGSRRWRNGSRINSIPA